MPSFNFFVKVRSIHKLWDATALFRANDLVVRLRYDHAFVDNQLYNWDVVSNSLVKTCADISDEYSQRSQRSDA